ncbi:MAG: hypothetical protein E7462_02260 [Ruminococcaceae bacterium]|nr:hypothetical protein [Oscillospiraceae bacterium]
MVKKILSVVLVILMLTGLCGCSTLAKRLQEIETPEPLSELKLGTILGNLYENEFIGIGCNLGEDWNVLSAAEIQGMNEQALGMLGEDFSEAIKNAAIVYELTATKGTDSISINLEKLNAAQAIMSEKDYIALAVTSVKTAITSMGYGNVTAESGKVTFAGKERNSILLEAEINGMKMYQTLVLIKVGGYMANIAVCSFNTNECAEYLSYFYAV